MNGPRFSLNQLVGAAPAPAPECHQLGGERRIERGVYSYAESLCLQFGFRVLVPALELIKFDRHNVGANKNAAIIRDCINKVVDPLRTPDLRMLGALYLREVLGSEDEGVESIKKLLSSTEDRVGQTVAQIVLDRTSEAVVHEAFGRLRSCQFGEPSDMSRGFLVISDYGFELSAPSSLINTFGMEYFPVASMLSFALRPNEKLSRPDKAKLYSVVRGEEFSILDRALAAITFRGRGWDAHFVGDLMDAKSAEHVALSGLAIGRLYNNSFSKSAVVANLTDMTLNVVGYSTAQRSMAAFLLGSLNDVRIASDIDLVLRIKAPDASTIAKAFDCGVSGVRIERIVTPVLVDQTASFNWD